MLKRLAILPVLLALIISGCNRNEEKPLNFARIDLDLFTRNLKGFNLLGKFDAGFSNYGFTEEEFIILHDLGFNFVRIPLDYRTYTQSGNWDVFLEDEVAKIDKVVEWGGQYGVHVCLNLHRAPGYCVNQSSLPANQDLDLWTNSTAQEAFVNQWAYFANRYKDVPWEALSYNLVNEPGDMDEAAYVNVMKKAILTIQSINPDRVIFIDGLNYSRNLIPSLQSEKNIVQAIHVYDPMTLTHYKAEWVNGSDSWPLPVWPMTDISEYLFGPEKSEYHSSLVLEGTFKKDSVITINVGQVSILSTLQIRLDDMEIYSKDFVCGPDPGEDWTQIISTEWGYQNISGKDYSVTLPADGSRLTITNTNGDWMTFNRISVRSGIVMALLVPGNTTWGSMQDTYKITAEGKITDAMGDPLIALGTLTNALDEAQAEGIPVMIQEFGVYNKTPHDITDAYLSDVVSILNKYHKGYAMWNLIGTMGIINSERSDVNYEPYRAKLLDREMTSILQSTGR